MSFDTYYGFDVKATGRSNRQGNFSQLPPSPIFAGRKLNSNLLSPAVQDTEWAQMSMVHGFHRGSDLDKVFLTRNLPPSGAVTIGVDVAAGELAVKKKHDHAVNGLRYATHAKAIAGGEPYIHQSFGHMRTWGHEPLPKFPKIPRKFSGIKPDHGELQPAPSCEENAQRMKRLNMPAHSSLTQQLREARARNAEREGPWDMMQKTTPWAWSHRTRRGCGGATEVSVEDTPKFSPGPARLAPDA